MQKSADFIISFIAKCGKNKKNPIESAREQIEEIDRKLKEADYLRLERSSLLNVLEHFGDSSYKTSRRSSLPVSSGTDLNEHEVSDEICTQILREVNDNSPVTIRELITVISKSPDGAEVIRGVKMLGEKSIIKRDSERRIVRGDNWDAQYC